MDADGKLSSSELRKTIRKYLADGDYVFVDHATIRMRQRGFVVQDVVSVLRGGFHDEQYDEWDWKNETWRYNISGMTFEGVAVRVVIALVKKCVIVTVIAT